MQKISGLNEIAAQFDAMLIDQFGVIHDGQKLYPGAAGVLAELKSLGIPVVIMTNSGKRADSNTRRIVKMGIPRDHFHDCVSSGEVAFNTVKATRAFLIGKRGDDYEFGGMQFVADPAQAEVMLILGSNAPETSLDQYREILRDVKLPAYCCNPDKLMLTPHGLQPAPGAIAAVYEELGGHVTWIGKPYPGIYHYALGLLGNPQRVLCIGDSAEHDVAGGRSAGLSTLLVKQGISQGVADDALHPQPDFLIEAFCWA